MNNELDYNEVFQFMKDFRINYLNCYNELIIDEPTNVYTTIHHCKDIDDVKTSVVFAICRPIGKGLQNKPATRILNKFNNYFGVELTKEDMLLMYQELCYTGKLESFKGFIKRGFPMEELKQSKEGI
jgi:hypothetical protein